MRANAICHAVSMPKIFSVLPSKCEELDEVLAFLYLDPTKPTPEDYKRTPFLVHYNKVIEALEWLKLNHSDYLNIEISKENMEGYSEKLPPVTIDYHEVDAIKDAESMAVNDNEEEDGTAEGQCPFTVQALTSEQLTNLLNRDERGIIRNKALKHFK